MSKINLNNVNGTYAKCISESIKKIYDNYEDEDVSTNELKQFILNIVSNANDTPAKNNFIRNLNAKNSKKDIILYISNVNLSAQHLQADPNAKWSSELRS